MLDYCFRKPRKRYLQNILIYELSIRNTESVFNTFCPFFAHYENLTQFLMESALNWHFIARDLVNITRFLVVITKNYISLQFFYLRLECGIVTSTKKKFLKWSPVNYIYNLYLKSIIIILLHTQNYQIDLVIANCSKKLYPEI